MTSQISRASVLAIALAASCAPMDCPSCSVNRPQVAHVSAIYGSAAFIDAAPASVNEPIHLGDHFYTGARTKMEVTLENGGTVFLDENTDPSFFQTAKCFVVRLLSGRMTVSNTQPLCVENGPNVANQHSYVLYEARSGNLRVTVFQGLVTTISPPGFTITTGQSMVLQNGRAASPPQQLSPAVLNRMQSWVQRPVP